MLDGIKKHLSVWREAWKSEREREAKKRRVDEKQFLPAALEILETPASPVGRTLMWLIMAFFTIAICWSIFGKVDVVATAQGQTMPRERVKLIKPAVGAGEIGVVRAIYVEDGQKVRKGETLIELDPTVSGATEDQAKMALMMAEVAQARSNALLNYLNGKEQTFTPPEHVTPGAARTQERLIDSRIGEYEASVEALQQQKTERRADLSVVSRELTKLEETLPLLQQQVWAREHLTEKGLSPKLLLLELQERLIAHKQDIEIAKDNKHKVEAAIMTVEKQLDATKAEFRKTIIAELAEAEDQMAMNSAELEKATERNTRQTLTSPWMARCSNWPFTPSAASCNRRNP